MSRTCWHVVVSIALLMAGILAAAPQQSGLTDVAGGQGGSRFSDPEPPRGARVVEVHVRSGDQIDSVQMLVATPDGRTAMTPRHGGSGGRLDVFRLEQGEYVTGISGRYGEYLDSLRIQTNRRTSPQFGGRGGDRDFRTDIPPGTQAVGFAGRAGDYVDALGLAFVPLPQQATADQTALAGGRGGSPFSDRDVSTQGRILEVRVRSGDRIDAVQAVYATPDGRTFEGPWRGGRGGRVESFRLDAGEYITGISGRYGDHIDSLQIQTSRRTSQRFGGRGGDRDFRIDVPPGTQATGFAGRAGQYLDAIGLTYARANSGSRWPRRY